MTGVPHYSAGRWTAGTEWLDAAWEDEEGIANAKTGLGTIVHLGYGDGFGITLYGPSPSYPRRPEGIPPYVLEVEGDSGSTDFVSAATLPDAMSLLGRWAPAVTAGVLSEMRRELLTADQYRGAGIAEDVLTAVRLAEAEADRRVRQARTPRPRPRSGTAPASSPASPPN